MTKDQKRRVHDIITGENYSYNEIRELAKSLFKNQLIIIPLPNEIVNDFLPLNENNVQDRIDSSKYDL
ncbi:hypothetical protein ACMC56_16060 [Campylobacterota bacterium DY0563]